MDIQCYTELARAHVAWAEGRLADCITVLREQRARAIRDKRDYFALRLATPLAVVYWRAGQPAEAMDLFTKALSAAAPVALYQLILDAGPDLMGLLTRLRDGGGSSVDLLPHVEELIVRCREAYPSEPALGRTSAIAESISPRERKVLELLGEGQSNKDVARTLNIAPETVKSHVKNIFIKLAVERRSHAVARALSLGLIKTS